MHMKRMVMIVPPSISTYQHIDITISISTSWSVSIIVSTLHPQFSSLPARVKFSMFVRFVDSENLIRKLKEQFDSELSLNLSGWCLICCFHSVRIHLQWTVSGCGWAFLPANGSKATHYVHLISNANLLRVNMRSVCKFIWIFIWGLKIVTLRMTYRVLYRTCWSGEL